MKRKALFTIAIVILVASVSINLLTFEKQTGQGCGPPEKIVENSYLFTKYNSAAEKDAGFIDCVGPSYFISYRPIDISILGILTSSTIYYFVKKQF